MNQTTMQLLIILLPLVEQLIFDGAKWIFTPKKGMTAQEQAVALEAVKKILPDMQVKI